MSADPPLNPGLSASEGQPGRAMRRDKRRAAFRALGMRSEKPCRTGSALGGTHTLSTMVLPWAPLSLLSCGGGARDSSVRVLERSQGNGRARLEEEEALRRSDDSHCSTSLRAQGLCEGHPAGKAQEAREGGWRGAAGAGPSWLHS